MKQFLILVFLKLQWHKQVLYDDVEGVWKVQLSSEVLGPKEFRKCHVKLHVATVTIQAVFPQDLAQQIFYSISR